MSAMNDQRLEEMLRSRRLEPPSSDLAERIILKAQAIPQNQALPLGQSIRRLFAEFHLPKPAYVLAGTLLIGLFLGFNNPFDTAPADGINPPAAQSFLYADEDDL